MSHTLTIYTKSPTSFLLGISRFISPAFIPEWLYERSISTLIYKNEKDLKTKLNNTFASQNEKKIHFSSEFEVSIQTNDKKIPSYVGQCLAEILPQQFGITKLTVADKLVSTSQRNQLAVISELAEQKKHHEFLRMRNGILTGVGLFAFATAIMLTMGMPLAFSLIVKSALMVGMISGVISHIRNIYLDSTQNYYQKNGKLKPINNAAEKNAFHLGEQAKNWRGYFTSYGRLSSYTHPIAFAAGMMHSLKNADNSTTNSATQGEYTTLTIYSECPINFAEIDRRIQLEGTWNASESTIKVPTQYLEEIAAKISKNSDFPGNDIGSLLRQSQSYKNLRVYGAEKINFAKIDKRIYTAGGIMESCPTQMDIVIPIKALDEILAKLKNNPKFYKHNQYLFQKNLKTKARP